MTARFSQIDDDVSVYAKFISLCLIGPARTVPETSEPSPQGIIAIDSIAYRRSHSPVPGQTRSFKGLLAIAISVADEPGFVEGYHAALDAVFAEVGLDRLRRIYKAYDISKYLAARPHVADAVVHRFGRRMLGTQGLRVNAFVGRFDTLRLAQDAGIAVDPEALDNLRALAVVPVYGRSPGRKYISVPEFIDLIEHPFPALAAWKLTQVTGIHHQSFLLDDIGGQVSRAWEELTARNLVQTVSQGDRCSPFISAADLLLRAVDRQLARDYSSLARADVETALQKIGGPSQLAEVHVHMISNPDVPMIAPYVETAIPTEHYVRHPLFVVINEGTHKDERSELESSPLYTQVLGKAYESRGSVVFYHPKITPPLIRDGDWVVHYGPRGKEAAVRLKAMRFNLVEWAMGEKPSE